MLLRLRITAASGDTFCKFVIIAIKYSMIDSTDKTKLTVISKDAIRCQLEIKGKASDKVMDLQYLRIKVSSDRSK